MKLTIDTSVFADFILEFDEKRTKKAEKILEIAKEILNPKLFKVELACILARRFHSEKVEKIISEILYEIALFDNPDEIAYQIALNTGCRAIDAYFIATAKLTNSILITNDRIMAENAKKYGIEAYYLIDEFDKAIERISGFKSL
ncbi:MAG: type II toxin-antitoxin system VapC family toxin [Archaeoglobaceae archaeon]